ncbi:nitroreductase family protein [uncultured Ruminococcus sp.]|uniref:nitroreductase family protein n=1 Tax=uncultured Ruminococcus sp. TaxID=165186 RepID=UPI0025CCB84D|nr:nitroreductase family protein [uncultured Ruminococcus sp.]
MNDIYELIKERKSVRTFNDEEITPQQRDEIMRFANEIKTPYGIDIDVRILDGGMHGLSSPVIVGTDTFIAGKVKRLPHAEEAFGYFFEQLVLHIQEMGLRTTWIAGTMNRKAFEEAMETSEDEVMPCMSPLGTAAEKKSVRETMMRAGIRADTRKKFGELFFEGSTDTPLREDSHPEITKILKAVQLAPSAVNKQPWRAVVNEDGVYFYMKHDRGYKDAQGWDMQKIDMGIALCHFALCAEHDGINAKFSLAEPEISASGLEYVAGFLL